MKDIQRSYMMLLDVLVLLQESGSNVIFLKIPYFMNKKLNVSTTLRQFSKFLQYFGQVKLKFFIAFILSVYQNYIFKLTIIQLIND